MVLSDTKICLPFDPEICHSKYLDFCLHSCNSLPICPCFYPCPLQPIPYKADSRILVKKVSQDHITPLLKTFQALLFSLRVKAKVLRMPKKAFCHSHPITFPPYQWIPIIHSPPASLASLRFLKYVTQTATPGPLHLLPSVPQIDP